MMISIIVTTTINYGVRDYMSVYTRKKWGKEAYVRCYMLDSLNEQYEFIGITEQELKEILGEPTIIGERDGCIIYKYAVGDDFTYPEFYDFIFDNGIVVDTSYS